MSASRLILFQRAVVKSHGFFIHKKRVKKTNKGYIVMAHYTKVKDTWKIIGLVGEFDRNWWVTVTRKDGTSKRVQARNLSRPFVAKFGTYAGEKVQMGDAPVLSSTSRRATQNRASIREQIDQLDDQDRFDEARALARQHHIAY